jgi:type I restriction enzyme S subunit
MRFRQGASGYSNYKGIVSPACTVLKPQKGAKYNPRYFHYMFRTGFYKNYAERYAYGIADGQMPLRYFDFKRMYSIVPPIKIQNSIVEYLDKKNNEIDKFIRNKERLIELLEERKSTIINEAICGRLGYDNKNEKKIVSYFSGNESKFEKSKFEWIGKTPRGWQYKKLPWVSKFQEGPGLRTWQFTDDGVKVICVTNITEGGIDFSLLTRCISEKEYKKKYKHFTINKGDYLLASSGASWGKVAEYIDDENVILNTSTIRFNSANNQLYSKQFIKWAMKSRYMAEHLNLLLTGSCQPNFGPSHLQKLILNVPTIEVQNSIVEFIESELTEIHKSIKIINTEITSIKEYREALITDLVTGKRSVPQLQMS